MTPARKTAGRRAAGNSLKGTALALIGGALLATAGTAFGGKPLAGGALVEGACSTAFDPTTLFFTACNTNVEVAKQMVYQSDAAYTGSCEGGGACADSVFNKLLSASAKFAIPKFADGCANLASIQSDLTVWSTAGKPKINYSGYYTMSAAIQAIQNGNCP